MIFQSPRAWGPPCGPLGYPARARSRIRAKTCSTRTRTCFWSCRAPLSCPTVRSGRVRGGEGTTRPTCRPQGTRCPRRTACEAGGRASLRGGRGRGPSPTSTPRTAERAAVWSRACANESRPAVPGPPAEGSTAGPCGPRPPFRGPPTSCGGGGDTPHPHRRPRTFAALCRQRRRRPGRSLGLAAVRDSSEGSHPRFLGATGRFGRLRTEATVSLQTLGTALGVAPGRVGPRSR